MLNIKKPKTVIEASKERIAAKMAEPMKNIVIGSQINFKSFFIFLVLNIHMYTGQDLYLQEAKDLAQLTCLLMLCSLWVLI